ncbi:Na+/H+ antiporter subunit E [Bartonella sp. HY329]|uniref:Na+/H+ antiporter subunit E n=1 Tax=unclassified Bartonella TaxID=2645622 RepID=UPI0021C76865|nr:MULTISPECIES: Na+/H+ antiporter subunit E [unclassified Bartonella]UXM95749.1 Na+/H+ antiporter subunit E [Bartonella sp. HY329]UXN10074.1 Na+/H+ antiporter subunit E [Bartonella sp. HY328]
MIKRIFPFPVLAVSMILMWMALAGFTPGQFIISLFVAFIGNHAMARLEPDPIKIKGWRFVPLLIWKTFLDITQSNIAVAWIILTGGRKKANSGFMIIPLELKDRTALAILGCVLTATPGTAWVAYDTRSNELLLHVLDLSSEDHWRDLIKSRYESLLLKIFDQGEAI